MSTQVVVKREMDTRLRDETRLDVALLAEVTEVGVGEVEHARQLAPAPGVRHRLQDVAIVVRLEEAGLGLAAGRIEDAASRHRLDEAVRQLSLYRITKRSRTHSASLIPQVRRKIEKRMAFQTMTEIRRSPDFISALVVRGRSCNVKKGTHHSEDAASGRHR